MTTMADDDLKNMVMSFRVSELQVLLGYAGRCKTGRKSELLSRALALVQSRVSTPIEMKIMELYRRRFPNGKSPSRPQAPALSGLPMPPGGNSGAPLSMDFSGPYSGSMPIHPDVRLKRLPFYDIHGELLKPSTLVPKGQARFQETYFVFHLTPHQASEILQSRDPRALNSERADYSVQIQLRFCLLETSCLQEDNFPPSICVRINGKMAPLPNPIPTNKPGMEPKRPSRPVNITNLCRLSPTVPNQVSVSWASEYGRSYCVSVNLVQKLNSSILLQRLRQKGIRHPDHSRALIKEKLATDPDSEIATTSLKVTLNCPLGKMKMSIPCRATTCNHLQCFDASTFLQMNEKKATWICPVCDKTADFDNLCIDGYFTEILKQAPDTDEIQFTEDGNWHPMKPKETHSADVTASPIIQAISDDSPRKENAIEDVIDLTETDDEEPQVLDLDRLSVQSETIFSSCSSDEDEVACTITINPC